MHWNGWFGRLGCATFFIMLTTLLSSALQLPPQCEFGLLILRQASQNLGLMLAEDKTEGPSTHLTVLGIEVDSMAMTLRVPEEKLVKLRALLAEWRKSGMRRDLESLVDQLQHACKVVRLGRCFLRRIYDLLMQTSHFQKHFHVRPNAQCQADIEWWSVFRHCWNGISILRQCRTLQADVHLYSDASGSWGCAAYWNSMWFQVAWQGLPIASATIAPNELFRILVACVMWGPLWRGRTVCAHCDNGAVVEVINRGRAKEPLMCHQLRALFFISAFYDTHRVGPMVRRTRCPVMTLAHSVHRFRRRSPMQH